MLHPVAKSPSFLSNPPPVVASNVEVPSLVDVTTGLARPITKPYLDFPWSTRLAVPLSLNRYTIDDGRDHPPHLSIGTITLVAQ